MRLTQKIEDRQPEATPPPRRAPFQKRVQRGFSLILLTVSLVVMLGMCGLAIDVGRMFVYKNELQTFADASALAAVAQLSGTQAGVQAANAVATAGPLGTTRPNGFNFDTTVVSNITATYATSFAGTYDSFATASSSGTNTYRFIKVAAAANAPLNFLPVLPGIATTIAVSAAATAGQLPQSSITNGGLLPFAPDAPIQSDTKNFGFIPGTQYTLKWGNGNTTNCLGDAGFTPPGSPPSEHGFIDIGEGNSNSNVDTAIEFGGDPNATSSPSSVSAGDTLGGVPGNRGATAFSALNVRAQQDTDDTSATYAQYQASGTWATTPHRHRRSCQRVDREWGQCQYASDWIRQLFSKCRLLGELRSDLRHLYWSGQPDGNQLGRHRRDQRVFECALSIATKNAHEIKTTKIPLGNALLEFALGFFMLWLMFSGVYQIGYAYYLYNILMISVANGRSSAPRWATIRRARPLFTTALKNMVVYGDETVGTRPVVPNLTTAMVNVNAALDANGIPRDVTITISGYTINAIFTSYSLTNKPRATTLYYGQISCSSC